MCWSYGKIISPSLKLPTNVNVGIRASLQLGTAKHNLFDAGDSVLIYAPRRKKCFYLNAM